MPKTKPTPSASPMPSNMLNPSPAPSSSAPPKPTFNLGTGTPGSSDNSSYKLDLGFGLVDQNGNPLSLSPYEYKSYITTLAASNPAAYKKLAAAVAAQTGKTKLDVNQVAGYVSGLAQNIITSSDIAAKSGSIEDWLKRAANASGGNSSVPQSYISSATQAESAINTAFSNLLGREATPAEIKAITPILNDAEKKNPSRYVNGATYGQLDKGQFLIDLITSGKYNAKPKAATGILSALAKEAAAYKAAAQGKKAGAEEANALSAEQQLRTTAINNDIHLTPDLLNSYLAQVKAGKDVSAIQQEMRNTTALGMPENVAKLIQAGTDLSAIYAPYRSRMASVLEIPADQINMNDASLRSAITKDGAQTLYDFERNLRQDPRWQYTSNAHDEVSQAASRVLQDFGFMG